MAINKKLIHFKKYETFNGSQGINGATEPTNGMYGNIPEHSIVFILDAKKIWTHGQLYDCDLSALEEIGLIKEYIELIQDTLAADKFKEYDKEYLTFTALEDSSIQFWFYEDSEFELLYSYDRVTWSIYEEEIDLPKGNKLYFKADTTEIVEYIGQFYLNGKLDVSGNIMSIVYSDDFVGKVDFPNDNYKFYELFDYCEGIYTTNNLILPALTLTESCYEEMFIGCSNMINAPELPAMTLANYCYSSMFMGCSSLTTAPELPAMTLANYCYSSMFMNCTSLTTAPELPGTALANYCYSSMFMNCTSLTTAPELPATALTDKCYDHMFEGCTSLTTAPELPATTLANNCYQYMFYGCTSLTTAPELPATTLANNCYQYMFYGCTSLTTAPELPATTLASFCYNYMFNGCKKLNYIKMLATDISATRCLNNWVSGVASTGTFVKHPDMTSLPTGPSGIPSGWTIEDYISPEDQLKELQVSVDSNTEEIDILKNRIISTTYSELKDAVTNYTLTTGQYYRITDYVTTCNGTSAKVTDVSTIDPENPVDGQSRSAGHQFDIIVRALSPNQLDENAVAVCNASETYYDSTFNGTVIKYSIENKYWSTEDGKGTIYYMKDHNDNECSYDFTNIEYYYAEDTTWYLTFNKDSSKVVILNTNTVLPFVIIYGHGKLPNSISITGSLLEIYMYAGAINAVNIKGTITNFKVIAPTNKMTHTININGNCDTVLLLSLGLISTITLNGYNNNIAINVAGDLTFCTFDGQHQNLDVKVLGANAYCGVFNLVGQSKNCSINVPTGAINCFFVRGYLWETVINAAVLNTLIDGTLSSSNIIASELNKVNFNGLCDIVTINSSKGITNSNFDTVKNIEITGGTLTISQLTFMKNTLAIKLLPYNGLTPSYIIFEPRVFNITIEGGALNITLTNVARNLHLKSSQESAIAADVTIHGIRGVSAESLLEIPLDLIVKGGCKKDIYSDVSGRIFHVWEDNGVKKGYYLNSNTDTEWKEYSEELKTINGNSIIGEGDITLDATSIECSNGNSIEEELSAKATKTELENYLPKTGGSITGNLNVGNVHLYPGGEIENGVLDKGGIDLINGTIEASEGIGYSFIEDSQGGNLLEILDTKAEIYTITDFSAYDVDNIAKGTYTLQINPSPLESAIRNNKVILIKHELGMEASPVLDAYIEDLIYLTVMYNSCIYLVFIELDLTVLTSASIDCMYNKTDLITDSVTISNALTITKDNSDYAHLNISEGLTIDNLVEWTDGSDTTASINYDGSASFTNLSVAGKNVTSFLTHYNSDINVVTSLSNVPTNKAVVFAHVGTSQELVFDSSNLVSGRGVHVFIYNNSSTTPITIIPLLDGSTFLCDNVTEFEIPTQSIAEVSMVYLNSSLSGSLKFIRSITV